MKFRDEVTQGKILHVIAEKHKTVLITNCTISQAKKTTDSKLFSCSGLDIGPGLLHHHGNASGGPMGLFELEVTLEEEFHLLDRHFEVDGSLQDIPATKESSPGNS